MEPETGSPAIFITGATGFLGSAVIAHLLESKTACSFLLLVRGADDQACKARVMKSVGRFADADSLNKLSTNLDVIRGDVLNQEWHDDTRLKTVTHALHLAANTSFVLELGLKEINAKGAQNVALAMKRRPKLQRYIHVGTAMICGTQPPQVVEEDAYPREGVVHALRYTESKSEAETLINAYAKDLPLIVARPSIAVGHSRLGCNPSGSIFWTLRAVHALKKITWKLESRTDYITVDYTAAALVHLLLKPVLAYKRYHISAGVSSSVRWSEINETLAKLTGESPIKLYETTEFSKITEEETKNTVGTGPTKRLLWVLERYYRFGKLDVVFDNRRLLAEGMPPPPRFTTHLERCLKTSAHRSIYEQMRDG